MKDVTLYDENLRTVRYEALRGAIAAYIFGRVELSDLRDFQIIIGGMIFAHSDKDGLNELLRGFEAKYAEHCDFDSDEAFLKLELGRLIGVNIGPSGASSNFIEFAITHMRTD